MKHTIILAAAIMAAVSLGLAQATPAGDAKNPPQGQSKEKQLDEQPTLLGGSAAIAKALTYPAAARKDSIQGIVYVEATVDKEGNVVRTVVLKGVREDLDKASMDAIKSVKFTPGKYKGKPVEAIVTIPINFKLK